MRDEIKSSLHLNRFLTRIPILREIFLRNLIEIVRPHVFQLCLQ